MLSSKQIMFIEMYLEHKERGLVIEEVNKVLSGMSSKDISDLLEIRNDLDFISNINFETPHLSASRIRALFAEAISDFRDKQWKCSLSSIRTLIRNDPEYFPIYSFLMGRCYQELGVTNVSALFYNKSPISTVYRWIGNDWVDPYYFSMEEEGEDKFNTCMEWYNDSQKLTMYIDSDPISFEYVKVTGPNIQTDMESGVLTEENIVGIFQWILKK